ncbi:MAG TPA: TetR/AcrR family transcriptional regulator [Clostridia bacterium]|nr:TetR/AcrR family transcriptional regulator [Clostridia bacterium]
MYETFKNLPESRREYILKVCIEEFAVNGYEKTSTNTIVKKLGISKGVLFLYFNSKKNLFLYIVDYLMERLTDKFFEYFPVQRPIKFIDIFNHMGDFYYILLSEDPFIIMFFMEALLNTPAELRAEVDIRHNQTHELLMDKMYISNMRKDIDIQMVLDLVHMASYHVGQLMLREYGGDLDYFKRNADRYIVIFNQYVDIIKYGVYE